PGGDLAEGGAVGGGGGPRAGGEAAGEDPADAGRSALERFDRARVVVGLDLERDSDPVAEIDGAGVLAGPHHDPLALGRQPPQQLARVLVGTVLGPEQAEHRQLDVIRLPPQLLDDELVLGVGQAKFTVLGRLDGHAATPAAAENILSPSVEPVIGSTACSGWGIRPRTLPASLRTPAMSPTEPLGLWPGA